MLNVFFRRGRKATWSGGTRRSRGARPRPETSETIGQPALRHLHVIYSRATEYICLDYPWNKPVPAPSVRCPFDATMASRSTDYQATRQMALVCPVYARLHHSGNVTIASSQRRHVSFLRESTARCSTIERSYEWRVLPRTSRIFCPKLQHFLSFMYIWT